MAENPYYSILKIVASKALAAINFPFLPKLFLLLPIAFSYQNRDFFFKRKLNQSFDFDFARKNTLQPPEFEPTPV